MVGLSLLCALVLGRQVTPVETSFSILGQDAGGNSLTMHDDGTFESVSHLAIAAQKVDSTLTGQVKDGTFTWFRLEETAGANTGIIELKDGKVTVTSGGKKLVDGQDSPFKGPAYFTNFHPIVWQTVTMAMAKSPDTTKLSLNVINALKPLECTVNVKSKVIEHDGKSMPVTIDTLNLQGLDVQFAADEKGECLGMIVPVQKAAFLRKGYESLAADPVAAHPELSQATMATETLKDQVATMRDGVKLVATVTKPKGDGPFPVILTRTPYGRDDQLMAISDFAKRGYAVVSQDTRGRGASEGVFDPLNTEVADGKDTLDWIAAQPWCNGSVGMIGGSYGGYVQWAAAVTHHPALKCIIPQVSPPQPTKNFPWNNGNFMLLPSIWWARIVYDKDADMTQAFAKLTNLKGTEVLPLDQVDDKVLGKDAKFFDDWIKRDTMAGWPGAFTTEEVTRVTIPVLNISGTWDGDGVGTQIHWDSREIRHRDQWLIFGPWEHGFNVKTRFGDRDYGPGSVIDLDSVYVRFFDTYLKGKSVDWDKQPRVKFFITGANKWWEGSAWPPKDAKRTTFWLSGSQALVDHRPDSGKASYDYDPNKVNVPDSVTPMDDSASTSVLTKEAEDKGMIFRSAPLKDATTIGGTVDIELSVSTTGKDASFFTMIMDIDPSGVARVVGLPGMTRLGYLSGKLKAITPGEVYKVTVDPWWFAHRFEKGHRIGVFVASDMFPGYARNPGTAVPDWEATKLVKVTNSVWCDKSYPSTVKFWTIPGG